MNRLLLLLGILLSGCGYTFSGAGTVLPPDVRKIAIPLAENRTVESGLGRLITDALREEFEKYGAVQVVESEKEADAVLNVTIERVTRESATVTSNSQSDLQLDATVQMSATLEKRNGTVLWSQSDFTVSKPVGTTAGSVVTSSPFFQGGAFDAGDLNGQSSREVARGQEQSVFEEISGEIAREIYDQAVAADF